MKQGNNGTMEPGFTLVELLVTIGVIVLLSVVLLPNIRRGERQQLLQRSAQEFAQNVRSIQGKALGSQELPSGRTCTGGSAFPQGYGIYWDLSGIGNDRYRLFADCNGNNRGTTQESALLSRDGSSPEDHVLPNGIILDEMRITDRSGVSIGEARTRIDITYAPPDADAELHAGNGDEGDQAWFRVRVAGSPCPDACKTVWVSIVGGVDVR